MRKINENWIENSKYYLAKLTKRYKADGKIFNKGKIDKETERKVNDILSKTANKIIKDMDSFIKQTNPEFPNNKKQEDFLNTILHISAIYDSIVNATKLPSDNKEFLPIDMANSIIDDLREYVKLILDNKLYAVYSTLDENYSFNEKIDYSLLNESYSILFNENIVDYYSNIKNEKPFIFNENKWEYVNAIYENGNKNIAVYNYNNDLCYDYNWFRKNILKENIFDKVFKSSSNDKAGNVRDTLKTRRSDGDDFDSKRIDTLKSNKLPIMLTLLGSALGGLGWLTKTEWFMNLFKNATSVNEIIKHIERSFAFKEIKPGEGMTQLLNRFMGSKLNINSSPQEFLEVVKQVGGGDINQGINQLAAENGIFKNPEEAKIALKKIAMNPNGYGDKLINVFSGKWAGTGAMVGDVFVTKPGGILAKIIVKEVVNTIKRETFKYGAGLGIAKSLGSLLLPLGIGLISAGALVKVFRAKGLRQSRAATLNSLYQLLRNVKPNESNIELFNKPNNDKTNISGEPSKINKDKGSFNNMSATDTDYEDVKEPKELGAGAKRLEKGTKNSKDVKNKNDALRSELKNLFQNIFDIKSTNILNENDNRFMLSLKNLGGDKNKVRNFLKNIKLIKKVGKLINKINLEKETDKNLIKLVKKIKLNPVHNFLLTDGLTQVKNKKIIHEFIDLYLNTLSKTNFRKLKDILNQNLNENIDFSFKNINKEQIGYNLKQYFILLFALLKYLNS
jgi:hypothetical protein